MRIGVVPNLDRRIGGIYQYAVTLLEALPDLPGNDEFVIFTYGGETVPEGIAATLPVVPLRRASGFADAAGAAITRLLSAREGLVDPTWRRFFERHDIDLLVFTADNDLAYRSGMPYVAAVHDLQHRLHPEFPEVSADGEWERREARLRPVIEHATVVLVDSEVGREDVLEQYAETGIEPDAVIPLPFLPAHYIEAQVSAEARAAVRATYAIEGDYLFYPAQFWPHKNHRRVVEAVSRVVQSGHRVELVLVGSHEGELRERTFAEVMQAARDEGIDGLVHHLGYVPDEDMSALYAEATALVMPTFFGPTNIPALEAFQLSCPVITSDIPGIRDHVGDAALLVDPESSASIADAIVRLLTEPGLRDDLISRGHAWLRSYTRQDYIRLLADALAAAKRRIGERA